MSLPANILIVDDHEANRDLLHDFILALGHTPFLAENGRVALEQIQQHSFDLILLDILMPELDGYQVLNQIKASSSLPHLPVIMISAVDEMNSVVRCIKMGADDYLIKPFNSTLLKARISACLEKKRLLDEKESYRQQIEDYNLNLEARVQEKTQELAVAYEKLQLLDNAKTDFLRLISHELRTPLNGIVGLSEVLFNDNLDLANRQEIQTLFKLSLDRLLEIVKQALLLTQIGLSGNQFSLEPIFIDTVLAAAIQSATKFAESRQVKIGSVPNCHVQVLANQNLLVDALVALIKTAIKFSNKDNTIAILCEILENQIDISIHATGTNIPPEFIHKFFEVFSIADSITPGGDIGLGPPVAKHIITLFNGTIEVENKESPGIFFIIKLKICEKT